MHLYKICKYYIQIIMFKAECKSAASFCLNKCIATNFIFSLSNLQICRVG